MGAPRNASAWRHIPLTVSRIVTLGPERARRSRTRALFIERAGLGEDMWIATVTILGASRTPREGRIGLEWRWRSNYGSLGAALESWSASVRSSHSAADCNTACFFEVLALV